MELEGAEFGEGARFFLQFAILEIWKNESKSNTKMKKCGIFPPSQESDINHDATIASC